MKNHSISFTLTVFVILLFMREIENSGLGKCPNYPSMPKFNMSQFLGVWYEVERSFYLPEIASGCTILTFQPENFDEEEKQENSTINNISTNKGRLEVAIKTINQWTGNPSINLGFAIPENEKSSIMEFQLSSRLPNAIARFLPGSGKYQILYTDYENFGILWSCSNFAIAFTDQIWLLGRDRDFPIEIRTKIYNALKELGLDSDRLIISKNKNCPNTLR